MSGGTFTLLHRIFQKTGMTPDVYLSKPKWVQDFIKASEIIASDTQGGGGENG